MACFEDRSKDVYPREALAQSRLRLTCEDDITANVARALELDGARRTALADEIVPRLLLASRTSSQEFRARSCMRPSPTARAPIIASPAARTEAAAQSVLRYSISALRSSSVISVP